MIMVLLPSFLTKIWGNLSVTKKYVQAWRSRWKNMISMWFMKSILLIIVVIKLEGLWSLVKGSFQIKVSYTIVIFDVAESVVK